MLGVGEAQRRGEQDRPVRPPGRRPCIRARSVPKDQPSSQMFGQVVELGVLDGGGDVVPLPDARRRTRPRWCPAGSQVPRVLNRSTATPASAGSRKAALRKTWLSIIPPCVGSGCRQTRVATGVAVLPAARARRPARRPSAVCSVIASRRAGRTEFARIAGMPPIVPDPAQRRVSPGRPAGGVPVPALVEAGGRRGERRWRAPARRRCAGSPAGSPGGSPGSGTAWCAAEPGDPADDVLLAVVDLDAGRRSRRPPAARTRGTARCAGRAPATSAPPTTNRPRPTARARRRPAAMPATYISGDSLPLRSRPSAARSAARGRPDPKIASCERCSRPAPPAAGSRRRRSSAPASKPVSSIQPVVNGQQRQPEQQVQVGPQHAAGDRARRPGTCGGGCSSRCRRRRSSARRSGSRCARAGERVPGRRRRGRAAPAP